MCCKLSINHLNDTFKTYLLFNFDISSNKQRYNAIGLLLELHPYNFKNLSNI